jgi:hypothetical protein
MGKFSPNSANMQQALGASFRDPAGFVLHDTNGDVLRHINHVGSQDYRALMDSGLYEALTQGGMLVPHNEITRPDLTTDSTYKIIKPQQIPYISYPFEWSFGQLRDAALLTLAIQRNALAHNVSLKDASAYNVQFQDGKPIFIDTLSFETYRVGEGWQAYRQFCQHFLAPLALLAYTDLSLSQLLRIHLDGVPLDLAIRLLPRRARLRPGLAMHLALHARAQKVNATEHKRPDRVIPKQNLEAIIGSLVSTVASLRPHREPTEWGDYYDKTNYTAAAADKKARLIIESVKPLKAKTVLDLGGNDGRYSRVLSNLGMQAICTDIDPNAVEANYRGVRQHQERGMLPLVVDLTNPGGALGWHNRERLPIHERFRVDVVMALALIHHLAISNNLPLSRIAQYFAEFGPWLLIEFVPKSDSQVKKLLSTRNDIFTDYHEKGLKAAFGHYYKLDKEMKIPGTKRTLYLFRRK